MSVTLSSASTQYLAMTESTMDTTYIWAFSCWVKPTGGVNGTAITVWESGDTYYITLQPRMADTNDPARFSYRDSGLRSADKTGLSDGTWYHICGQNTGTSNRTVYIDGTETASPDTSTTAHQMVGNAIGIGCLYRTSMTAYFNGDIAQAAIWTDYELTGANITSLAGGALPSTVSSGDLLAYYPLTSDGDDDSGNGRDLTAYNTPTFTGTDPPAFSSGLSIPIAMRHYLDQ